MLLPQREPDRPPRGVAGPSTRSVVACLLGSASPEDSLSRRGDVQRDGGRWWFLPGRDGLATSGWCADPRLLRVNVWQSSVDYAEIGIGGTMSSSGLCRVDPRTIDLSGLHRLWTRHNPDCLTSEELLRL